MPAKRNRTPQLGSVSCGTLRTQDLLRSFADTLAYYRPRVNARLIQDAREVADCIDICDNIEYAEEGSEIIWEISTKLNQIAPEYVYFGAHDGDGSDFGFWPVHEAIEELEEYSSIHAARKCRAEGDFRIGDTAIYRRYNNGRIVPLLTF